MGSRALQQSEQERAVDVTIKRHEIYVPVNW